ncbi:RNA polymerase sigma-70 factor [Ohtaekwangia sp.]|uniref:RNA polymerase sigma-70 factor n=1 Tax=Ohtaekwangia sp. TaxID=2066019 RepID=UPI002F937F9F
MVPKKTSILTEKDFEKIYDAYWSKLYNLCYCYFKDRSICQEVVQDVFVKLWLRRDKLPVIEDLNAYLYRALKNKIYDQFDKISCQQKLKKSAASQLKVETHCTEEQLEYEEALSLINSEIEKLPDTTKAIFRLSRFDRYTNDEIAKRLHVSSKAVEYHITSALKHLRIHVGDLIILLIFLSPPR